VPGDAAGRPPFWHEKSTSTASSTLAAGSRRVTGSLYHGVFRRSTQWGRTP